jgi:flagellar motor switch/type III secretory pathway protein FliN
MNDPAATPALELWSRAFASAIAAVTGASCETGWQPLDAAELECDSLTWWRHDFDAGLGVLVGCERGRWPGLRGGEETPEERDEALHQLLSAAGTNFAVGLSEAFGETLVAGTLQELPDAAVSEIFAVWAELPGAGERLEVIVQFDDEILRRLGPEPAEEPRQENAAAPMGCLNVVVHARVAPTTLTLAQVFDLRSGSVIPLGPASLDPIEISVKGRVIARGRFSMRGVDVVVSVTSPENETQGPNAC